ncbi:hypothetical protein FRC05_009195 [Tulasnella sp. 425]|nr:hypothetical protein FRC05_009195 [Tulasnella sp. 425]
MGKKEASAPISVLVRVLFLLNMDQNTQSSGSIIIKSVLLSPNTRRLISYFGSTEKNLSFWTCRLFGAVADFGDGQFRKEIFDVFPWGHNALWPMLSMRRKDSTAEGYGLTNPPGIFTPMPAGRLGIHLYYALTDIRTTLVLLILSFVQPSTHTSIKLSLLDKGDAFSSIFRDIGKDSYALARRILDVSWEGIWGDTRIPFGTKIAAFGDQVLTSISKLYGRYEEEGPKDEPSIAEIAHHFLLALCTRPGSGVCFKSRGWYARNFDARHHHLATRDDHQTARRQENSLFNRVLPAFVKTLKPNDDPRQQELVLKVLEAAPELIPGFWQAINMTLEPRLSSRWITNIALATKIVSLPSPVFSFRSTTARSPSSSATPPPYIHSPPPIQAILDSILPITLPKAALTKGLRSSSTVVRHLTATLLAQSIKKTGEIAEEMKRASEALEEDETSGSWALGRKELLKEVSGRIPELVEVARMMDLEGGSGGKKSKEDVEGGKNKKQKGKANPSTIDPNQPAATPSTLVHEVASRLMWYYHRYLPNAAAESHVGMRNIIAPILEGEESQKDGKQQERKQPPLRTTSQLHGLRLLEELESYDWSVKIGTRTALYHVLQKQMTTPHAAIRNAGSSLLQSFFSRSLIFEHDPDEIQLWLSSFPRALRKAGTTAPDGTPLSDEVGGFLAFFDACLSRCLKTPYRYLEEGLGIISQLEGPEESRAVYTPATVPSPLFFTILEELRYRVSKEKDNWSSDLLAVFAFLRKFILSLLGKQPDLQYVHHLARVLEGYAEVEGGRGVVFDAVRRELKILRRCLEFGDGSEQELPIVSNPSILKEFMTLSSMESLSWQYQASVFTDRLRFDPTSESEDVVMLMASMLASLPGSTEAMRELLLNLSSSEILWALLGYDDEIGDAARRSVPFHYAFIQANGGMLRSDKNIRALAAIFRAEAEQSAAAAKRNANLISLRVQAEISGKISLAESSAPHALRMLNIALGELARDVASPAVHQLFATEFVREICSSQGDLYLDLTANIRGLLSESSTEDKDLVQSICAYWSSIISGAPTQTHSSAIPHVIQWVPFMSTEHLLSCLDVTLSSLTQGSQAMPEVMPLLESVLYAIMKLPSDSVHDALASRTKALVLLSLQPSRAATLISKAVHFVMESALPIGLDTTTPAGEEINLEKLAAKAAGRWRRSLPDGVTLDLFEEIIGKGEWSQSSTHTVTVLMYRRSGGRLKFAEWLASDCESLIKEALPVVSAFLDAVSGTERPLQPAVEMGAKSVAAYFNSLAKDVFSATTQGRRKEIASNCMVSLIRLFPDQAKEFRRALTAAIESATPAAVLEPEALMLLERLAAEHPRWAVSEGPFDAAVELALKWVVRRFAEDKTDKPTLLNSLGMLGGLLRHATEIKPYLAEPVLTAAVQHRLDRAEPMQFASQLACNVTLKAPNTNRLIQAIVQHPQFQLHVRQTTLPATREALVSLSEALFKAHPNVTCQPNSIAALVSLYTGTQSLADRRILSVFQLFERHRRISALSLLSRWSAKAGTSSGSAFEAVTSLDPTRMERTFLNFPQSRSMAVDQVTEYRDCDEDSYDPVFVMLLLAACVNEGSIKTGISWVELCRTSVLSVVVAGMSSREGDMRRAVASVLGLVWRALQKATFHERDQTLFVLNRLRHFIPPPDSAKPQDPPPRLPTCTSLLFAHALHCIFNPATFFYPVAMRFLLQRPTFNPNDVPLIFEMLFKGNEDWKQHRKWMITYLRDSMRGSRDWVVLRKRHTWDLLATIFQESPHDPALRLSILEVFLKFTANPDAVTSLVLRSSLLNWMENQCSCVLDGEELPWAMIVENILTMSDHEKLDANTAGGWRASVGHILETLLKRKGSISLLAVVSRCLLRLASSQSQDAPSLSQSLEAAVAWLQEMESEMKVDTTSEATRHSHFAAPFTALPITASNADEIAERDAFRVWGTTVQTLWQLAMTLPASKRNAATWDPLTSRLLAWNLTKSFSEKGRLGDIGEWARREVIQCISA